MKANVLCAGRKPKLSPACIYEHLSGNKSCSLIFHPFIMAEVRIKVFLSVCSFSSRLSLPVVFSANKISGAMPTSAASSLLLFLFLSASWWLGSVILAGGVCVCVCAHGGATSAFVSLWCWALVKRQQRRGNELSEASLFACSSSSSTTHTHQTHTHGLTGRPEKQHPDGFKVDKSNKTANNTLSSSDG